MNRELYNVKTVGNMGNELAEPIFQSFFNHCTFK